MSDHPIETPPPEPETPDLPPHGPEGPTEPIELPPETEPDHMPSEEPHKQILATPG